jgi:hypothetical protein
MVTTGTAVVGIVVKVVAGARKDCFMPFMVAQPEPTTNMTRNMQRRPAKTKEQ